MKTGIYSTYTNSEGVPTIPPVKKAVISSDLFLDLSKSGRQILVFIIDVALTEGNDTVILDIPSISKFLSYKLDSKQANYYTIRRGIRDLLQQAVIFATEEADAYKINPVKITSLTQTLNSF
jgi:hypothetical protein